MTKKIDKEMRLLEEHLQSINNMQEAETDPFFYTRLRAKMEKQSDWQFPLRPSFIVTSLALLLLLNACITINKFRNGNQPAAVSNTSNTSLQSFATDYDLTIQTTY